MENIYCICCNNVMQHFLILSETNSINVCDNCFHLQKSEMLDNDYIKLPHYNETAFMKFIFNTVVNYRNDKRLKILSICDNDTNLLDTLFTNITNFTRIPRTYINTVSLSLNFRPSYFSKHKCYRDNLSETTVKNLKSNYTSFDIIILNTTMLTCKDPNKILQICKELCNLNTNIFLVNYHSLDPVDYLTIDKTVKNLFTTNSLKLLCTKNDFELNDAQLENNYSFYKIIYSKSDKVSDNIVSSLYDEMNVNIYDIDTYIQINLDWYNTLSETFKLLDRYILNNYEIVYLAECKCCQVDNFIQNNDKIKYKINDLAKLNGILKKNGKYIFIVLRLNSSILKELETKLSKLKCYLMYDIKNLITIPIIICD